MSEAKRFIVPLLQMWDCTGQPPALPSEQVVVIASEFDRVTAERDALQERLNAADQKDDDLSFQLKDREDSRRDWFEAAQVAEKRVVDLEGLLRGWLGLFPKQGVTGGPITTQKERTLAALSASAEPSAKPCKHEWTDDGEFLLICTACGAQEDHNPGWREMAAAPRDGTMLRLLVEFEEHSTEDAEQAPTIGANNFDHDGEDHWSFAGWCWTHDHFVDGKGTPIGWLPMLPEPLYTRPGALPDTGTSSDKYKAELYDEVWQKARNMGFGNVTDALMKLEKQAAVVLPEQKTTDNLAYAPESRSFVFGWNACIDEVARLNPPQQ